MFSAAPRQPTCVAYTACCGTRGGRGSTRLLGRPKQTDTRESIEADETLRLKRSPPKGAHWILVWS